MDQSPMITKALQANDNAGGIPLRTIMPRPVAGWGLFPVLGVIAAAGLLLIAFADSAARRGTDWAQFVFWTGLLLLFVPVILRLSSPSVTRREGIALVVMLGLGLYVAKVLQSPLSFVLHDEFSHWRTANDILDSGHLFSTNPLIPVSPFYPGLEIVTTAMSNLTGLSIFASGILVLGAARLLLLLALYLFFERISRSTSVAGLACVLYMTTPNYVFFDSQFAYESLALPVALFLLFAVAWRADARENRLGLNIVVVLALIALAVTHHITSYITAGFLVLWTIVYRYHIGKLNIRSTVAKVVRWYSGEGSAERQHSDASTGSDQLGKRTMNWLVGWYTGGGTDHGSDTTGTPTLWAFLRRRGQEAISDESDATLRGPGSAALLLVMLCTLWLVFVGTLVIGYISPQVLGGVDELARMIRGEVATRQLFVSAGEPAPLWLRLCGFASVGILLASLPFGLIYIWKHKRKNTALFALAIGALAYPASLALRLTQRGAETSNRASEFVFVALAIILSLGVVKPFFDKANSWLRRGLFTGLATVLFVGGLTVGWPYWGLLPGPYLVGADPRSIEPQSIAAADWARNFLGPDRRIAADRTNGLLLGSYGQEYVVSALSTQISTYKIFFAPEIGPDERDIIRRASIQYVLVDHRLSTALPQVGFYYERGEPSTMGHTTALDPALLAKFDTVPGVSRLYDSGDIVIYDVRTLSVSP